MSPQTASQTLNIVGYVSIGFALAIAGAAWPPTSGLFNFLYDMVDWPMDGAVTVVAEQTRLLSAISGGVFASWSVLLILIVAPAVGRGDEEIRRAALIAILVWFFIDSAGSLAAGFPVNAAFNTVYLGSLLAPLLMVKKNAARAAAS